LKRGLIPSSIRFFNQSAINFINYEDKINSKAFRMPPGALYEDRELVVDANLITSRQPEDLPAFMREIMKQIRI